MGLLCPQTSKGFVDKDKLFQLIVGELALCSFLEYDSFCDIATPKQVGLLSYAHMDKQQQHYELIALAVKVGYINAKSNKNYTIFDKSSSKNEQKRFDSIDEKQKMLQQLEETF